MDNLTFKEAVDIRIFKRKYNRVIKKLNKYSLGSLDATVIKNEFLSVGFSLDEEQHEWYIGFGNLRLNINPILSIWVCEKIVLDNNIRRAYSTKPVTVAEKLDSFFENKASNMDLKRSDKQLIFVQEIANKTGLFRKLTSTTRIQFTN